MKAIKGVHRDYTPSMIFVLAMLRSTLLTVLASLLLVGCGKKTDQAQTTPTASAGIAATQPAAASTGTETSKAAAGPWDEPEPNKRDRRAYFSYLERVIPTALEKVPCACCRKSLLQCYRDMRDPAATHKCPFG